MFDIIMELSEDEMMKELPVFATDPSNRAKIEALLKSRQDER